MDTVLLGTGAADGWPNPFCRCASCADASRRGEIRGQTAALVDDRLLLDCGPEAPRAASRLGRSLADVRAILVTHDHPDHFGPQALLFRSWVGGTGPIDLVGPVDALDRAREWIGPGDPVTLCPVAAGDRITVAGYEVRVLAANHRVYRDGDSVLYDVTGPDGDRLLWATDTGPVSGAWFDDLDGARYDAVFLDTTFGDSRLGAGHHSLDDAVATIGALRAHGAVDERTDVVAVHLGHHHRSIDHVATVLGSVGARVGSDGDVVTTAPDGSAPVRTGSAEAARPRGERELVLGGVRSGKSVYAEERCTGVAPVVYVACGPTRDDDPEWADRVRAHRDRRPSTWSTVETDDVATLLRTARDPLLIDCLGTWLTARADLHGVWFGRGRVELDADIDDLVAAWRDTTVPVVAVSNEVGSGVVPASESGRLFRDLLGALNTRIAAVSDRVTLVVAGVPMHLR